MADRDVDEVGQRWSRRLEWRDRRWRERLFSREPEDKRMRPLASAG
jgi:hypothetical protein